MLEKKPSLFKKETEFKKAIDEVNDAYKAEDIATLEIMKIGFESAFHRVDKLFVQDKCGDFDVTSQDVREKTRTLMNLSESAITVATHKLKDAYKSRGKAPSTSAKANSSKRSDKLRSQSTAKSSTRVKAFAELAAAKEQAQFDLQLAEKKKSWKERQGQEELRKATETAKYEHDVAVT